MLSRLQNLEVSYGSFLHEYGTYRQSLNSIPIGLKFVYYVSGASIKKIHYTVVASTQNKFTILEKADLPGSHRPLNRNGVGANSIPRIIPVESCPLRRVIYAEDPPSKVCSNVST